MLKSLRSDEALDLGSFAVGLLAFRLGLHLTTDDELADLFEISVCDISIKGHRNGNVTQGDD